MLKLLTSIVLLVIAQTASAWTNKDFRIANNAIEVLIQDDAKNGCWTNLGEVRNYAEAKLSNAGAIVKNDIGSSFLGTNSYWFSINVIGYRLNSRVCIGVIETMLYTIVGGNELHFGFNHNNVMLVNSATGSNLNNQVLDVVGDSIREFN